MRQTRLYEQCKPPPTHGCKTPLQTHGCEKPPPHTWVRETNPLPTHGCGWGQNLSWNCQALSHTAQGVKDKHTVRVWVVHGVVVMGRSAHVRVEESSEKSVVECACGRAIYLSSAVPRVHVSTAPTRFISYRTTSDVSPMLCVSTTICVFNCTPRSTHSPNAPHNHKAIFIKKLKTKRTFFLQSLSSFLSLSLSLSFSVFLSHFHLHLFFCQPH